MDTGNFEVRQKYFKFYVIVDAQGKEVAQVTPVDDYNKACKLCNLLNGRPLSSV